MNNLKILDCTLRDGGYYTNWDFEKNIVREYFMAMERLPIDYLEIGYRSKPLQEYLGEFFYCPKYIFEEVKRLAPSKKIAIILNEKDCLPEDVDDLLDGFERDIDLVRIAIDPKRFDKALLLAKEIKNKGFSVAFNVMYMSKWINDKLFLEKLDKVNGLVDFFYMVDSYGSVYPDQVRELIAIVKSKVNVPLGFHGHNNLELAHINTLTAIECGCQIVDATITGMGRGAGNLKTELLLTHFSSTKNWKFNMNDLSVTVSSFEKLQENYKWGTNLPYMFSGANSLPQKEVMEWIGLNRYPLSSIVTALENQKDEVSDNIQLPIFEENNKFTTAVIVGGGSSIINHNNAIFSFLNNLEDFCIIHAGVRHTKIMSSLEKITQYYCMVGSDIHKLNKDFDDLNTIKSKCIFPPFPRKMGTIVPKEIRSNSFELKEISFIDVFHDSPLAIAVQTAMNLSVSQIILIGFDGYKASKNNVQFQLANENQSILDRVLTLNLSITSATKTMYKNIPERSLYSYIR